MSTAGNENDGTTQTAFTPDTSEGREIQGFATKDGEVISRSGTSAQAPGRALATPAVKAKGAAAPEGDDQGQADDAGKHKSAQARIDRAVGRQREAERERDAARTEKAALEARLAAIEARVNGNGNANANGQQQQRQADGVPQPTDYQYGELDAAYIRDLAKYEARQEILAQQQQHQARTTTADQQRQQEAFKAKADEFRDRGVDKYDDFEDVVFDNSVPISPIMAELAFDSDHGPDILYALAQDLKEAKRVSALSPARQAAWFGRKEAELSSEASDADEDEHGNPPQATSPKTPQAPPPPQTRTRGSGGPQRVSADTSDFAAFERMASTKQ